MGLLVRQLAVLLDPLAFFRCHTGGRHGTSHTGGRDGTNGNHGTTRLYQPRGVTQSTGGGHPRLDQPSGNGKSNMNGILIGTRLQQPNGMVSPVDQTSGLGNGHRWPKRIGI